MYAVKIPALGKPEVVGFPGPDDDGQFDALRDAVGGWIEHVNIVCYGLPLDMWVNEEGLLKGLPYNAFATRLYRLATGADMVLIVGDAIITSSDVEGETLPLTQREVDAVMYEVSVYAGDAEE